MIIYKRTYRAKGSFSMQNLFLHFKDLTKSA